MLFDKPVYYKPEVLASVTKDESEQKKFVKRLKYIHSTWEAAPLSSTAAIGVAGPLKKAQSNALYMAVVLDKRDYIEKHVDPKNKNELCELRDLAFVSGSKNVAELFLTSLEETYHDNDDTQDIMLEYIASSGNFDWLIDVLKDLKKATIPSCCYNQLKRAQIHELKKLNEKLQNKESEIDQVVEKILDVAGSEIENLDSKDQELVICRLAARLGMEASLSANGVKSLDAK